jgi:hypothetical protein
MVEGQTQSMTLEDVEARVFGCFVHWLYFQTVHMPAGDIRTLIQQAELYSLGDRFMVGNLRSELECWIQLTDPDDDPKSGNTLKDFQQLAYSTRGDTTLRQEAVRKTHTRMSKKNMALLIAEMPLEMLVDFTLSTSKAWLEGQEKLCKAKQDLHKLQGCDDRVLDLISEVESDIL